MWLLVLGKLKLGKLFLILQTHLLSMYVTFLQTYVLSNY